MAFSATHFGVPITPIYGFGKKRWEGYESLSGQLGMVYQQYVPPAMEPGVVVSMAKLIPHPHQVLLRGQGPFNGLGYTRFHQGYPAHEPAVVRRMARDLDTPMMAGAFGETTKPTFKDAAIGVATASVALVIGVGAVYWFAREMAR